MKSLGKPAKPLQSKSRLKAKSPLKATKSLKSNRTLSKSPKTPLGKLRKDADKWFSRYIRLRDSEFIEIEEEVWGWYGTCITCTRSGMVAYLDPETAKKRDTKDLRFIKGWDNGHWIRRGNMITRYEEMNCNLQCKYRCNKWKSGEPEKHEVAIRAKFGDSVPDELKAMASMTLKRADYERVIADCKKYVEEYVNYAKSQTR